jgi:hypothetical protein
MHELNIDEQDTQDLGRQSELVFEDIAATDHRKFIRSDQRVFGIPKLEYKRFTRNK